MPWRNIILGILIVAAIVILILLLVGMFAPLTDEKTSGLAPIIAVSIIDKTTPFTRIKPPVQLDHTSPLAQQIDAWSPPPQPPPPPTLPEIMTRDLCYPGYRQSFFWHGHWHWRCRR